MLGIFGGSFDPPHFGHIKSALALLERYKFEHIRFVPCQLSPLKKSVHASSKHRWQMLNLVCDSHPHLIADDRELKRQAPSYTMDTVLELRKEIGDQQSMALIVGVDAFLSYCKWHRYEEILSLCHIILLQRPGYSMPKGSGCEREYYDKYSTDDINQLLTLPSGKILMSDLEQLDISSTMIRKTISDDEQPKYMLPGNVWNYILRNKLYK